MNKLLEANLEQKQSFKNKETKRFRVLGRNEAEKELEMKEKDEKQCR